MKIVIVKIITTIVNIINFILKFFHNILFFNYLYEFFKNHALCSNSSDFNSIVSILAVLTFKIEKSRVVVSIVMCML
jgi:hypothetical protein